MSQRKKTGKVTISHRVTIGALSVMGLLAGWNLIGQADGKAAAANDKAAGTTIQAQAQMMGVSPKNAIELTPKTWSSLAPLNAIPRLESRPVPTLVAVQAPGGAAAAENVGLSTTISLPGAVVMPTLAPLPGLPQYVAPPPPPPAQVAAAPAPPPPSGGGVSQGS